MHEIILRPATTGDIDHVAANLRPEHIRELEGCTGMQAATAVRLSVTDSIFVFAGSASGSALFLAGVSRKPLLAEIGSIWMVATKEIDLYPLKAAVALRDLFSIAHDLANADTLEQWLPVWYRKGIKWLLWLGWCADGEKEIRGIPHLHMVHTKDVNNGD